MTEAEWDARYAATDLLWSASPNKFVEQELSWMTPGRALDLGAGEGRNSIWLAQRGWTVSAVDFSSVALERGTALARRADVTVDWIQADLRAYSPAPGAFDLVLIAYLQFAEPDLLHVLHGAARALAPGGTLFVIGHDRDNLEQGYGGPQDPDLLYNAEVIASALASLSIVSAGPVTRPVQTPDGPRTAIDTQVRATRPS
jgi:SAM-dependent methyltransferase